ncbi:hypothetical protein AB0J89_02515 [Micromonospora chokoriensis]
MIGVSAARGGWVVRFLLLAATLIGLAAMHSLGHGVAMPGGHAGHGMHPVGHPVTAPAADLMSGAVAMSVAVRNGCAGDGCAGLAAPGGSPGHTPSWAICLAVVGGFGVALAMAGALLLCRSASTIVDRRQPPVTASRGPPAALKVGQRVTAVSVLRV